MANNNETVNEIRAEVGEYLTSIGPSELPSETQVEEFADRFASAHEREMNALAAQKTAEAHEAFVKNAELAEAIAAKDAMIAEQSAVNESQAAQLRDALNECEELKCAIADSKRISDAVVKSLRDKKLEMAGQIAAKDAEIASLRLLVKELADALDNYPCHNCKHGSERCEWCGTAQELDALVAKARKMIGGAE